MFNPSGNTIFKCFRKVIFHDEPGFKMWQSWYGLMCRGENKVGNMFYRWSFIFMNRSFHIGFCPKALSFSIQVSDLYHWEPTEGPPKTIFYYHN